MSETASNFVGGIPENYDQHLGPNLFDFYGREMARHVAEAKPERVLEIAAGTGIVTRHVRDALPTNVQIVATDLNPPMLEVAQQKFAKGENVTFTTADAQALDYPDDHFDLVFCQFGVMFFPDRVGSYREAARVIRPGGRYLFSSWGTNDDNPYSALTIDVLAEEFQQDVPGFYKVPFFYNDIDLIRSELGEAGLANMRHNPVAHDRTVTDFALLARGAVFGNPLFQEVAERGGDPNDLCEKLVERYRATFGQEPAKMPLLAHFFDVAIA